MITPQMSILIEEGETPYEFPAILFRVPEVQHYIERCGFCSMYLDRPGYHLTDGDWEAPKGVTRFAFVCWVLKEESMKLAASAMLSKQNEVHALMHAKAAK